MDTPSTSYATHSTTMDTPSTSYDTRSNTMDTPSTSYAIRTDIMDTPSTSYATHSKKKDTPSTSNATRSKIMDFPSNRSRVTTRLSMSAHRLLELREHDAAARIAADCLIVNKQQKQNDRKPNALVRSKLLDNVLDKLLNSFEMIDDLENINWLRWLMASGKTLKEFDCAVKGYDTSKCCRFVWTEDYLAYSCHSCKTSYNAALCIDCFKHGDHIDHDAYMFRSQGIGVCNCGNPKIMKPEGYCPKHSAQQQKDGDNSSNNKQSTPDVLRVTEKMMPRLLLRLMQYLRTVSPEVNNQTDVLPQELSPFLNMIYTLSKLGTAVRHVMTVSFTNKKIYLWACNYFNSIEYASHLQLIAEQKSNYEDEYGDENNHNESVNETFLINNRVAFNNQGYSNFMDEIVYWTIKYEFSHKLIVLLIHMLPDEEFRKALTKSFSVNYKHVPHLMETTQNLKSVDYNSIRLSAELFGYEDLALQMATNYDMFRVILLSLLDMMKKTLIPSSLHNWIKRTHRVVDLANDILSEHRYWSMTNNLNLMLTSKRIASHFIQDDNLINLWFSYLSMFQGMNTTVKEMDDHVEYDSTKLTGFSTEFKITACTLRTILLHLKSTDTRPLTISIIKACLNNLRQWLMNIDSIPNLQVNNPDSSSTDSDIVEGLHDPNKISLHLPLHRFLAGLLNHTVRAQDIRIKDILPQFSSSRDKDALLLAISTHPLRTQAAFYEIVQDAWVRNGQNIKRKALLYVYPEYCTYLMDSDIYLLQVCLSEISDANKFMGLILKTFNAYDWMNNMHYGQLSNDSASRKNYNEPNIENIFVFLATLIGVRTNLCSDIAKDYCQINLEMVTILCLSNTTHSQIMERIPNNTYIPKTCSNPYTESAVPGFDSVLLSVADFKKPCIDSSEMLRDGFYVPSARTWKYLYDPVHVFLRADSNRRTFQTSMDRYTDCMRSIGLEKQNKILWPPYRTPYQHHLAYNDPRKVLLTKLFHTLTWQCLYKSLVHENINERILSLVIHLLDQAWIYYTSSGAYNNALTSKLPQPPMNIDSPGPSSESYKDCKINTEDEDDVCPKKLIKLPSLAKHNNQGWTFLFDGWFDHDDLVQNLCTTISIVKSKTSSSSSIATTNGIETKTNNSQTKHSLTPINESIISLLLKLHSNLSDRPDSYQQPEQSTEQRNTVFNGQYQAETQTPLCGDGEYYISRLLDKMTKMSTLCYECVSRTRLELWPKVESDPISQEEIDSRKNKRKLALMEEMAEGQRAFLESALNFGELDSTNIPPQSTNNAENMPSTSNAINNLPAPTNLNSPAVSCSPNTDNNCNKKFKKSANSASIQQTISSTFGDCAICRKPMSKTTESRNQRPLGLVIFIQNTNLLAHRRHSLTHTKPTSPVNINDEESSDDEDVGEEVVEDGSPAMLGQSEETTYIFHFAHRQDLLNKYFNNLDINGLKIGVVPTKLETVPINGNVHVQTCGHYLHLKCLNVYINKLPNNRPVRYKFLCPVCRQLANSVMPFIPAAENNINPFNLSTLNSNIRITVLTNAINKLTELLVQIFTYHRRVPNRAQTNSSTNVEIHNANGKTYNNFLIKSLNLCVRQMIEHDTPVFTPSQHPHIGPVVRAISKFSEHWQSIISVAWTNINIKLVQLDNSAMKQQHEIDSSITTPIIGDTSDSSNVNNKLSKYNCLGPLLKALHLNAQLLLAKTSNATKKCLSNIWYELIGCNPSRFYDPPLMLRDPCEVLLQLVFIFPTLDHDLFDVLVAQIFNMQVYISALKIATIVNFCECSKTDLFNFPPHLPSIVPTKFKHDPLAFQQTSLSFSNLVALSGNIVFKYQIDGNVKVDKKNIVDMDENEKRAESYARQSALPFLRFAAFLKKHMCDDDIQDDGLQTQSSSPESDSQTQVPKRRNVRINIESSTSSSATPGRRPRNQQLRNYHWSEADYEYLKLVRYLNLLIDIPDRWPTNKNYTSSSQDGGNGVECTNTALVKPPAVMESVFWPKMLDSDGTVVEPVSVDATFYNWLTSFRESLRIKLNENATNLVDLPAAARLLFGIDCCNGGSLEMNNCDNRSLVSLNWVGPRLLELPTMYIDLFQIYYNKTCNMCKTSPKIPNLCLVCGALLCSQSICCRKKNVHEVVQHSLSCGSGTGVFLDLNTCTVMLIRDKFYTYWGSPYLDEYGEEDYNLERGIPLRLNNDRYALLERQWLTHRLDFVRTQWNPHFGKY